MILARIVAVREGEARALGWSFAYFFCLLAAYYVLRPLRDEMGIAGGVRNLPWLFTATFLVMLAAVPAFGAVVARLPRRAFIPLVYHFFAANLAIFWAFLAAGVERAEVARVFFVWISVFNLFAVSVFWSFMADVFTSEQGKRLFGFIAAGGSAGALLGPLVTVSLVGAIGPTNLLVVAALLLEGAVLCASRLEFREKERAPGAGAGRLGGSSIAGIVMILRSPYLAGIAAWMFFLSLAGTFLYLQQAQIVSAASADPAVRTRIFASIDLAVGILTILVQFLATGKLLERFGVGRGAAFLPLVFAAGFVVLALSPVLAVVVAFQAIQRTANFAVSNPSFQLFFTVLDREEKYKAKNVIDLVVFRGSDAVSSWLFAALRAAGMELAAISLSVVPLAAACGVLALALGRVQERRAAGQS
ncbi:MAG TPA: MFS transporter [Usitatibacter sp.]|nr:MFS transporter [Usitatibacter sp.]